MTIRYLLYFFKTLSYNKAMYSFLCLFHWLLEKCSQIQIFIVSIVFDHFLIEIPVWLQGLIFTSNEEMIFIPTIFHCLLIFMVLLSTIMNFRIVNNYWYLCNVRKNEIHVIKFESEVQFKICKYYLVNLCPCFRFI